MQLHDHGVPRAQDFSDVTSLDPLGADDIMAALPRMNREANPVEIIQAIQSLRPVLLRAEHMTVPEMIGALRDMGMLIASLRRLGFEPIEVVPEVEAPLLYMGSRTGMVPRDTVYHYSVWNPAKPRQRTFLGDRNEDALIDATRIGAVGVEKALEALVDIYELPFDSPRFIEGCHTAAEELMSMVDAIAHVRHTVSPEFFARVLRPFYDEVILGGKKYNGSSAAPLSIGVVDLLLWSSDVDDPEYRGFQDQTMVYNMPRWKRLYRDLLGQPSMLTRLRTEMLRNPDDDSLRQACAALVAPMRVVLTFRGRHRLVAQSAYTEQLRLYPTGSAGYGIDTLEHVLKLSYEMSKILRGTTTRAPQQTEPRHA